MDLGLDRFHGDLDIMIANGYISGDPWVVRVIPAMRGQIEGHRKTALSGGQIASVKGIGIFGRGESGILADGPRPTGIHGGHGPAHVGRHSRQGIQMFNVFKILCRI